MGRVRNQAVADNQKDTPLDAAQPRPPGSRRATWRDRLLGDATFVSWILLLALATAFALTTVGSPRPAAPKATSTATPAPASTPAARSTVVPATAPASARPAQARVYPTPVSDAGLMQPAVDAQGNIWVGEMSQNKLARLDPRTGKITEWAPPNGKYNIMATAIDAAGNVWFTEQVGNYIGRFDPRTETFKTYPLGQVDGRGMAPQDLQFDRAGNLWFTELGSGRIGRLDPASGNIREWPIPAPQSGVRSYPYSLAVTPAGEVWLGYLTGGAVSRLDPASGKVAIYHLAENTAIFSMAPDAQGNIWFTGMQPARLGHIDTRTDTRTDTVSEMAVPAKLGDPATLYAVKVAPNGDVWFASAGANAVVRYRPSTNSFLFFQLGAAESLPYGLDFDRAGHVWFSADGGSGNYIGMVAP
jgi:virginiamycin B lyase